MALPSWLSRRVALYLPPIMFVASSVYADGVAVDRVYDPYVQPLETEIEWRSVLQFDDEQPDREKHALGFGRSLSERWAMELYLVGSRVGDESLQADAFEMEFQWQITEQGEYAFDWGALFEVERNTDENIWEVSTSVLAARDLGRWTNTVNLGVVYEWGSGVDSEFESLLRLQTRYRLREEIEPALELHLAQDVSVLGPTLSGLLRLGPGKKLRWDAGVFFAIKENSPDQVIKLNFEYEF